MNAPEWSALALSAIVGAALGLGYFGGLWLTVQRLPNVRRPGLLILASFLGRMTLLLFAILWLAAGHFDRLLAALAGLLAARLLLIRRWRPEQYNGNHA
jgi:F1F0 ATPase subunit 2